jgi:hypothetical protein
MLSPVERSIPCSRVTESWQPLTAQLWAMNGVMHSRAVPWGEASAPEVSEGAEGVLLFEHHNPNNDVRAAARRRRSLRVRCAGPGNMVEILEPVYNEAVGPSCRYQVTIAGHRLSQIDISSPAYARGGPSSWASTEQRSAACTRARRSCGPKTSRDSNADLRQEDVARSTACL